MPLVGRSTELEQWARLRAAATAGAGSVWFITGMAGVGKTSLLRAIRDDATSEGWTVLAATGNPAGGPDQAWGILTRIFVRLATRIPAGSEPFDGPGTSISDLVLGKVVPTSGIPVALTWTIETLAAAGPTLLVIDDAHWGDAASLQAIASAISSLTDQRVVVVIAARAGELPPEFEPLIGRPGTSFSELTALSRPDIAEWLRATDFAKFSEEEVGRVAAVTGGLPLLIAPLVHDPAVMETLLNPDGTPRTPTAPGQLLAIGRQYLAGFPQFLPVLAAVAVLDSFATSANVATVLEIAPHAAAELIAEATRLDLLDGADGVSVAAHPLLAEVVLENADLTAPIYLKAALALGDQASVEQVGAWLIATPAQQDPRVLPLLLSAIERSITFGFERTARELVERARLEPPTSDEDTHRLKILDGKSLVLAGDVEGAVRAWRAAMAGADASQVLDIQMDIGDAYYASGQTELAREAFLDTLAMLEDDSIRLSLGHRRLAIARLAAVAWLVGEGKPLEESEIEAILAQDESLDGLGERALLSHAALELTILGRDAPRAAHLARRAAHNLAIVSEDGIDGPVLSMLTGALNGAECDDEALALMTEALRRARISGSVMAYGTMSYCRAYVHMNRGRLRRARQDAEAALRTHRDYGWGAYLAAAKLVLARVALAQGDLDAAKAAVADLDVYSDAMRSEALPQMMALHAVGLVAQGEGDHERAFEYLRAATEITNEYCPGPTYGLPPLALVRSAVVLGHRELASDVAAQAIERARTFGAPRTLGRTLVMASAAYPQDEAIVLLREGIRLLELHEGRLELGEGRVRLAHHLAELGGDAQVAEAIALARGGIIEAERIGSIPVAQRARTLLADLGERHPTERVNDPVASLTASEVRVCELAAKGMTNRQIAAELYVTVKAVEWHLWRAYPKLGIKSRRDLPLLLSSLVAD
ncbi:AAA family ATPase [Rarobacter faecitabidus]|uniref:ATP/maltotriose-dependent transcriptional regulator MalT n=1 Tax=Rarobacter faecitabidus TaxID=13243 RepID=A0A542ZWT8_RARFA|nr:LuxR family transcriptional regulator [Rarobacter faecitabidus]TQL64808.1 ATP/maltotriose-dependent transcriptional regulator MalT [Rarobacter faecitabidus]